MIMLYLSPMSGPRKTWRHPDIGWMVVKNGGRRFNVPAGVSWAADCGLEVATSTDDAVISEYIDWLGTLPCDRAQCIYAVAPDVLGDAAATWERSAPLLPQIRALGYPSAFVAQDGFDASAIDWDAFDVLFIGGKPGDVEWKRSESGGLTAIREGKRRGKWVHVGRVNGRRFLRLLATYGADSADGSLLCHGPEKHWPLITGALDGLREQPPMSLWEITA